MENKEIKINDVLVGTVSKIVDFGAFVNLGPEYKREGLIHISKLSDQYVREISNFIKIDQKVKVKVININDKKQLSFQLLEKLS